MGIWRNESDIDPLVQLLRYLGVKAKCAGV
jgi:hypothetical protein